MIELKKTGPEKPKWLLGRDWRNYYIPTWSLGTTLLTLDGEKATEGDVLERDGDYYPVSKIDLLPNWEVWVDGLLFRDNDLVRVWSTTPEYGCCTWCDKPLKRGIPHIQLVETHRVVRKGASYPAYDLYTNIGTARAKRPELDKRIVARQTLRPLFHRNKKISYATEGGTPTGVAESPVLSAERAIRKLYGIFTWCKG